jgi:hypothetical protein
MIKTKMNNFNIKNIGLFSVLFLLVFAFSGCSADPNKVVIDKKFLGEIEKAFREEAKTGRDMSSTYNEIWRKNRYELIYISDIRTIHVIMLLISQKNVPPPLNNDIRYLVDGIYDCEDPDIFWQILNKQTIDVQLKVLKICDYYDPMDWDLMSYLNKHPDVKKLYIEKYGIDPND